MGHEIYYLVRASAALRDRLSPYTSDMVDILLRPLLFLGVEADRSAWREREHVARMKLLFLAYLKQEYGQDEDFKSYLGDVVINIEVFDRWWVIERHSVDQSGEDITNGLTPAIVQGIEQTGIPLVDDWISKLQEQHRGVPRD